LFFDLKHFIIPDKIIFLTIGLVLVFRIWDLFRNLKLEIRSLETWNFFLASLTAGLFFFLIFAISKGRWMGFGDV